MRSCAVAGATASGSRRSRSRGAAASAAPCLGSMRRFFDLALLHARRRLRTPDAEMEGEVLRLVEEE